MGCAVVHWQNIPKVPIITSPKNGDPVEGRVVLRALVELKLTFPISLFGKFRLVPFIQHVVTHYQVIHFGSHETTVGVLWSADDRFASPISMWNLHEKIVAELSKSTIAIPMS